MKKKKGRAYLNLVRDGIYANNKKKVLTYCGYAEGETKEKTSIN